MENNDIDLYIESQATEVKKRLQKIRKMCLTEFPDAKETISYGIPTIKGKKNIIHYAGYENHIGIYPGPKVVEILSEDLKNYHTTKGTVQFPNAEELPVDLILKIIKKAGEINDSK